MTDAEYIYGETVVQEVTMIYITRTQKSVAAVVILILVIISGTIYIRQEKATEINLGEAIKLEGTEPPAFSETQVQAEAGKITVYICGAVKNPGVIEVTEGTRLDEAIRLLGGANEDADLLTVNLAYRLADEDMVYIPKKGEKLEGTDRVKPGVNTAGSKAENKQSRININTAGESELDTLPGIGPATAKAIIKYREQNGVFKAVEDIKLVTGIGDSKFNKIKDSITVD